MITMTQTSTGDVWTYGYDFRNRLVTAVEKTSGGTTLESVTYTYDALDNRIGMDENGTQTWTLYDGSDPIMDFSGSGSLTMRYLNGPTGDIVDAVLGRESAGGTIAWYLPDRLGTIRDLINNSRSIIDHVDYSAFGTLLGESNPTNGDRMMGFAGMERDTVTELNLAVEREENPGTGRWDTQDPFGFLGGQVNVYSYVCNQFPNLVDSYGLQAATPMKADPQSQPGLTKSQWNYLNQLIQAIEAALAQAKLTAEQTQTLRQIVDALKNAKYRVRPGKQLGSHVASTDRIILNPEFFDSNCDINVQLDTLIHEGYHMALEYNKSDKDAQPYPGFSRDRYGNARTPEHYAEYFAEQVRRSLKATPAFQKFIKDVYFPYRMR
jgi:RHS repeat-associated protein